MNGTMGIGIKGLRNNTEFYNANDPSDKYYVNIVGDKYIIKRAKDHGQITLSDPTLVLYSNPQNAPLSFTGQYHIKQSRNMLVNSYRI